MRAVSLEPPGKLGLLLGSFLLLSDLVQHHHELLWQSAQDSNETGDRRLEQEHELGDQLLSARQGGDLLDFSRLDRLPLDQTCLELERRNLLSEVGKRLG